MRTFDIIILVVALILLAIAGGFAAKAASDIKRVTGYANDSRLTSARTFLIWAAVVAFIAVFLILVMVVLYFIYGNRADLRTQKFTLIALMIFTFVMIMISGVLAAIAATRMRGSGLYRGSSAASAAYNWAVAAAVLLLVGVGLLFLIYMFVFFLRKPSRLTDISNSAAAQYQALKNQISGTGAAAGAQAGAQAGAVAGAQAAQAAVPVVPKPVPVAPVIRPTTGVNAVGVVNRA